jgi:hypothetical protein
MSLLGLLAPPMLLMLLVLVLLMLVLFGRRLGIVTASTPAPPQRAYPTQAVGAHPIFEDTETRGQSDGGVCGGGVWWRCMVAVYAVVVYGGGVHTPQSDCPRCSRECSHIVVVNGILKQ